jgi:hypothetical protein
MEIKQNLIELKLLLLLLLITQRFVNIFKDKISCCSVMDTVGIHIPIKQVSNYSTFSVSNVSRLNPSLSSLQLQTASANF